MLEVSERAEMEIQQIVMISLSDKEALRRLRFTPSSPKSNFPAFSGGTSKNLCQIA